jgi:hypothetical protein
MAQAGGLGGLGGFFQRPGVQDTLDAIFTSMISSPRNNWLANFGPAYNAAQDRRALMGEQAAMQEALVAAGLSPEQAKVMAVNPQAAKLRLDMMERQRDMEMQAQQRGQTYDFFAQNAPEYAAMIDAGLPVQTAWSEYIKSRQGGDPSDYAQRAQAAAQFGLTPDDPGYQSFILTGKMPREDAQPLTATDKKAILEADDMVAANENAIVALDQAEKLSDDANSGWFAGARAAIGNNLPDVLVPDVVSSPDSSQATTDMDNAIVGQALTSLKAIFGGNPTEGERKILLDLQGSSSMPKAVRKQIIQRAKELAKRRLEFNRQRAAQLRGGDYYRPQGAGSTTAPGGGTTSGGVQWSIEP